MTRRTLLTLLLCVFVAMLGMGIIVPILPIYATELGASGTALGVIVAIFSVSRGLLQPVVGGYSDRTGRKVFMAVGMVIYAVAGLTYAVADSVLQLIVIRAFHGVGSAMIVPVAMSYVASKAPEGGEGRAMGQLNVALFLGIGGGPLLGGVFLDAFGTSSTFYVMSALAGAAVLLLVVFLPPEPKVARPAVREPMMGSFFGTLRDRKVVGILLARLSSTLVVSPAQTFLPLLMAQFIDASGTQIGMVIGIRTLVNAALQTPLGRLTDRVDRVRMLIVGSVAMGISVVAIAYAGDFFLLLALFMLMGAGEAIVWPVLGALATESGRVHGQGTMMGLLNMSMSFGFFAGSLGAGAVVDGLGLKAAFIGMGILIAVGTAIAVPMLSSSRYAAGSPKGIQLRAEAAAAEAAEAAAGGTDPGAAAGADPAARRGPPGDGRRSTPPVRG